MSAENAAQNLPLVLSNCTIHPQKNLKIKELQIVVPNRTALGSDCPYICEKGAGETAFFFGNFFFIKNNLCN